MDSYNPISTPSDPNTKLTKEMSPTKVDEKQQMMNIPYQEAIGSILYLTQCTRPDISFAISNVSKYCQNPGPAHWSAVKRIFRYLKYTKHYKLEYSAAGNRDLIGYSDADWGSDSDDRRSCSGYVFMLQGGAVSWASKKQQSVALSSTEAEYMALSLACQEVVWLRQLEAEALGYALKSPTIILCDNHSALNLANTDAYRVRTKHIDIRHNFIRDKIYNGDVKINSIDTTAMVADNNLTKSLHKYKQRFCANGMGLL